MCFELLPYDLDLLNVGSANMLKWCYLYTSMYCMCSIYVCATYSVQYTVQVSCLKLAILLWVSTVSLH